MVFLCDKPKEASKYKNLVNPKKSNFSRTGLFLTGRVTVLILVELRSAFPNASNEGSIYIFLMK